MSYTKEFVSVKKITYEIFKKNGIIQLVYLISLYMGKFIHKDDIH